MHTQPDIHMPQTPAIKVYEAILTQTGTAAPVPTILKNTLGYNLTWTRQAQGVFRGTGPNAFDETKLWLAPPGNNFAISNGIIPSLSYNTGDDYIQIDMFDFTGTHQDTAQIYITILLYN